MFVVVGMKASGQEMPWRTVLALMAGMLFLFANITAYFPVLPLFIQGQGHDTTAVGIAMAVFGAGVLCSRPLVGQMVDRWGTRPLLFLGGGLLLLVQPLYALANTLPLLYGVRLLHGLALACFATATHTAFTLAVPPVVRTRYLGYLSAANTVGFGLGPVAGLWAYRSGDYEFFLEAMEAVALCVLLTVFAGAAVKPTAVQSSPYPWSVILRFPVRDACLFTLVGSFLHGGITSYIALWSDQSGLFFVVYALTAVGIRLLLGNWGDRLPVRLTGGLAPLLMGLGCTGLFFKAAILLWAVVYGLGFGLLFPVFSAVVAGASSNQERGRVFSIFLGAFDLGITLGSGLLGYLLPFGTLGVLFFATGSLGILLGLYGWSVGLKGLSDIA
ncbi:MFS transporter [Anthocerotibacter panamensis]|uniref:MFS transporter n=1 Tax=Anthocerotibacter panamensis TaxID=2857077 RepID=UPI001C401AFB|nr:MFS transporter [Anthocerotibacter panamensis]